MNSKPDFTIAIISTFVWVGFVGAISFMEAWLKFQAPGITLELGLGIGKLVFNALNKVEWMLAISILINQAMFKTSLYSGRIIWYWTALIILIVQSVWLLPALDARAEAHINNETMAPSNIHFYYIAAEALKEISLIVFGIRLFR